ncbi:MAG: AMP-binding protein [Ancalomicrobiaceae bacterium]|nr:AMP-binding protein [Ancalomicrobiaceae bacterium]
MADYDACIRRRLGLDPTADHADVQTARSSRLAAAIAAARTTSPFYRRRTDWPAGPVDGAADLPRLPFTTPEDLARADPPLVAVSGADVARIVTLPTSGTSGTPKRIAFGLAELEATVDYFHHGMAIFTEAGDRVAIAFASDRPASVGDGLALALKRLGAIPLRLDVADDPAALVAALRHEGPDVVAGPPVTLLAAARLSAADGGPPIRLKAVLVSSDYAAPSLKRAIVQAWDCAVHDHWGMTETGYGGAVDCPAHLGLHLREADLFVEVIDPATGRGLPPGEEGEIVISTLQPRATPLVRYRTGDIGRLVDAPCACGSHTSRLVGLRGRIRDEVVLGDGLRLALADIDDVVFGIDGVSDVEASVTVGPSATLALRLAAPPLLRSPALAEAVRRAVAAAPAWGHAVASGRLRLEVTVGDTVRFTRAEKRRLHHEVFHA